MTSHLTGGLNRGYKPRLQALLLLTRHLPLKEAFVLLTIIPKEILILFYT